MNTEFKKLKSYFPILLAFGIMAIALIWISFHRTPWRDEIITLFYVDPENLWKSFKEEVHHPLMYVLDSFLFILGGKTEAGLRIFHGLLSLLGLFCFYVGLKRKFSATHALLLALFTASWSGWMYYSTSIRSNWSLIAVPQFIFAFYPYWSGVKARYLVPILTFLCSLHLINLLGIPFALVISARWYGDRFPSKSKILTTGAALLLSYTLYKAKLLLFGTPHFASWSGGATLYTFNNLVSSLFYIPWEACTNRLWRVPTEYQELILSTLKFGPLLIIALTSWFDRGNLKEKLRMAALPFSLGLVHVLIITLAELAGMKLLIARTIHFAYLLLWSSFAIYVLYRPRYKIISVTFLIFMTTVRFLYLYKIEQYPIKGPQEKEFALHAIEVAKQERAIIISCDDYFVFKVYPPPQDLLFDDCEGFSPVLEGKQKYMLTQLTWIELDRWRKAERKLLESGYEREQMQILGPGNEFLKVFSRPEALKNNASKQEN